jgi:hypothetical protein
MFVPTLRSCLLTLLLLTTAADAANGALPWKTGDEPPVVAGISLGQTRDEVEEVLGKAPETQGSKGGVALIYVDKGLVVLLNALRQAAVVYLVSPAAGVLDGVQVGADRDVVLERWGNPTVVQGAEAMYLVGDWAVVVELGDGQKVEQMIVTRVFGDLNSF